MSEDAESAAFFAWFACQYPALAGCLIHVANEGGVRSADGSHFAKLAKRKKMGVVPGVADYLLAAPRIDGSERRAGLWVEMKAEGGSVKPEQVAFLRRMDERGYACVVTWGWGAAAHAVSRYIKGSVWDGVAGVPYAGDLVPLAQLTLAGRPRATTKPGQTPRTRAAKKEATK